MNNYESNEAENLNPSKRSKCQSTSVRTKNPPSLNFEFKSSLFTEKNKSLIEKLISQNISQESSFSKEEKKDKAKEKIQAKKNKAFSTIKSKIPKSVNTSLLENNNKDYIKNNEKKLSNKNILANKNNSTIAIKNKDKKHSIINCQIKPLHKKYLRISERPIQNPQKKVQIQTMRNSIEKKKMVFNGITKDIDKNKTRNNPINHKPKQNSNLSISIKPIFQRKKIGFNEVGNDIKNKNIKNKTLRNSMDNKFNYLNIITVNTINIKERKRSYGLNNTKLKSKNKNKTNLFASPRYRNTIQYK